MEQRRLAPAVACVAIPVVLGAVYLGGWWLFALVAIAAVLGLHEFWLLARPLARSHRPGMSAAAGTRRRRAAAPSMIGGMDRSHLRSC